MRKAWRAVGVYLGFRQPDDTGPVEFHFVRQRLVAEALLILTVATIATGFAAAALGWDSSPWLEIAIGTVLFGVAEYFWELKDAVPAAGLLRLPEGAEVDSPREERRSTLKRLVFAVPASFALVWLMDVAGAAEWWIFIPGQLIGMASARIVAAAQVARWERTEGTQIAARGTQRGITALYAVPRL